MKKILLSFLLATGIAAGAQTNYALSFNGTNNYVDGGNSSSFNPNNIKTMECWVKLNSLTGSQEILAKSVSGQGIELLLFNNALSAYFMYDGSNVSYIAYPLSNLQTGTWYHLAVTWDGTKENIRLYVNGVSVGTRTDIGNINSTGLTNPAGNFRIGNWADPTARYFNGTIDEVRIWNSNRTAAQLKSAMFQTGTTQTGLVAYYKMDQGSGTSLPNSTAITGLTGTLVNSPAWVASPVQKSANALDFDGTNDHVNLGTSATLKFSSAFTAEMWVKSANWAVTAQQQLLSCFESGGYGITLTTDGKLNFFIRSNTSGGYVGISYPVSNLTNNTWYHVAGTFDGRYIQLYVNGNLAGTYDFGSSGTTVFYTYPSNPVFIGADPTQTATPQGLYFSGQIDEVRLWNTARSQAQIQSAMDTEIDPSDAAQTTGLVSYYTFNEGTTAATNTGLATVPDQRGTNNATLTNFALTGSTSNFVAQKAALVVLPVTYLSFTTQRQGSQVLLQWSTAQEQNTSGFTVQHSTDNQTWNNIAGLPASGYSNDVRRYSYVHTTPAAGTNLYRLLLTDQDGKTSYSTIRTVSFNSTAADRLSYAITGTEVRVQLSLPSRVTLYSLDGKKMVQKVLPAGQQSINVSHVARGIYLLNVGNRTEKILLN